MRRRVAATTRVASVNRRVVFVRGNDTAAEVLKTTSCSVTRMGVREGSALSQTPSVRDTTPLTTGGTPNPANLSSVLAGRMGFSTTAVAASRGVFDLVMPQCSTRALGPRMGHLPQLSGLLVGRERSSPRSATSGRAGAGRSSSVTASPSPTASAPLRTAIFSRSRRVPIRNTHPPLSVRHHAFLATYAGTTFRGPRSSDRAVRIAADDSQRPSTRQRSPDFRKLLVACQSWLPLGALGDR